MGRFRPRFTIGGLMIAVAVSAIACWLATDATAGWIALLIALPILILVGPLVALTAICVVISWLGDLSPVRDDPPGRPSPPQPSTGRTPR